MKISLETKNLQELNKSIFSKISPQKKYRSNPKTVLNRQSICANLYDWQRIKHFLELGGSGSNFINYVNSAPKIYLVDIVTPKYSQRNLCYINCDLNDGIPFKKEIFDAVFAGEIIEHLLDTDKFLEEIYRVLKPKGTLVLTTPNASSFINLYKWLKKDQFVHNDYKIDQNGHVRYYSPNALIDQLKSHGFKIIKVLDTPNIANIFKNSFIRKTVYCIRRMLFPLRGMHIIVQCLK